MAETVRAFVAIQLSAEVNEAVATFQAGLRRLGGEISWTGPANFHLTLRFFGNRVAPGLVAAMIEGLRPIAATASSLPSMRAGQGRSRRSTGRASSGSGCRMES